MRFTYEAYETLIKELNRAGYVIANYHNYNDYKKCVILRHDVDNCPEQALRMAEFESKLGVTSTWFFLLRTEFYNVASKRTQEIIQKMKSMGHQIGLHFDEMAYSDIELASTPKRIEREINILSQICGFPIKSFSMHRPSKITLDADYQIPGIVNTYGKTFFQNFNYMSDSRAFWREPVMDIVVSGIYNRLHILTHAFWYHEKDIDMKNTISGFINRANEERYNAMFDNIRDFGELKIDISDRNKNRGN